MVYTYYLEIQHDASISSDRHSIVEEGNIHAKIENSVHTVFREEIEVKACHSLMKGVHARQFFVQLTCRKPLAGNFIFRLNRFHGKELSIISIHEKIPENADVADDISKLKFHYYIGLQYDPFLKNYCFFDPAYSPDVDSIVKILKGMEANGVMDTICAGLKEDIKFSVYLEFNRMVFEIDTIHIAEEVMLQTIAFIIQAGKNGMKGHEIMRMLTPTDHPNDFFPLPAGALHLVKVEYPYLNVEPSFGGFITDYLA